MTPRRWRADALAKINIGLRVTGRRADGYHDIQTVFQSIAIHDTIRVRLRSGDFRLESVSEEIPLGPDNLVWRAAQAVWHELGRSGDPCDAEVTIEKRVPVRAGLGGGSADAAAALLLLAGAWGGGLSVDQLDRLARGIGADVPFFLTGGCARGSGRGDVIEPAADRPRRWVVLVLPEFGVSTVEAFGWFDDWVAADRTMARVSESPDGSDFLSNDLEAPVAARHPSILELKRLLLVAKR